ncbi:helix-turn-helix domain-containing protein [Thermostaphylospora chromogena]|uniref:Tetratricopeptide repeat-containing protein n=1 Tax=Thermostaphylospora chromogena TaxID=35622 RepID=A0A1H1G125_9ACTN|nr:helix-turn-helix domain-containing protein [Thermostaphylospora chromogena]SDR06759.1 Tetratricopeptide repeat-containing protein [Thermostaphylospora chromogena]
MTGQDLIGQRIKAMRRQRGLSQAQLAHPELSDSYISLIESGKRTPTAAVLELLASKLDCSLSYLVNGVTAEQLQELELELNYAKIALDNGEVQEARRRYGELVADPNLAGLAQLRQEAEYGLALAMEACGDLDAAVATLNGLRASAADTMTPERRIAVTMALSRCYRERGDLAAAVQVGEQILCGPVRPAWTDELVELGATLLSAYLARGDLLRAGQFAAELLAAAEVLNTPRAIVAANWNAAITAEHCGRGEEALPLVERALAVQGEIGEPRNLARLRLAYAILLLRVRPSEAATCRDLLLRAQRELTDSAASTIDNTRCTLYLARAELALGRPEEALRLIEGISEVLAGTSNETRAEGRILLGQTLAALGRREEASRELAAAEEWLRRAPVTRQTAASWAALAEIRADLDDHDDCVEAYQRALVSVGL